MILHPENWMNIRRFRALHEAGASYAEIAAEAGCDWRTVKKYLAEGALAVPPAGSPRKGTQPRKIAPFEGVIDGWLRADVTLRASVICERLAAGYGYAGSYQRVKLHVAEVRPKIAAELAAGDENPLAGLHRRFEVVAGAQAQVDWGEESGVLIGTPKVYSFHMVLSYSRDPFCCYTARTDLATFFGCHIRAFEYFGGVPGSVVYDRTKTVVKRHVAPGKAVPLHHGLGRRLPANREGAGGTPGRHRPRPRAGRPGVRLAGGDGRRVPGLGAAAPRPGAPHAPGGDRGAGRG
jgi:transposase